MTLGDLTGGRPHVCGPETTLAEAARAMAAERHGSLAVVEGRSVVGIITERDLVRAAAEGAELGTEPVARWMSVDPDVFDAGTDVFEAAQWLLESGYRHLPVVSGGELLGVVSVRDLLRGVVVSLEEE